MDKLRNYVKRNVVFVSLLSIISLITCGLGLLYLWDNQGPSTMFPSANNGEDNKEKKHTYISNFSGGFSNDSSINLNWQISEYEKEKVRSIELFHEDVLIANVNNLKAYSLPLDVYGYPTGMNNFTLKISLENDKEIKKTIGVKIDEIFNSRCVLEEVNGGILIKMYYSYYNKDSIGTPNINVSDTKGNPFNVKFHESAVIDSSGVYINAYTSYFLDTSSMENGDYSYHIRFIFKDKDLSFDYPIVVKVNNVNVIPPVENNPTPPVEEKPEEDPITPDA